MMKSHKHMTTKEDLTPRPPLQGGEGEKTAVGHGIVRNQIINPEKLELAKYFRKNPTKSENIVWQMLRNRQINNLKWRRQQVIDGFIADFYCSELNTVLEIDGTVHDSEEEKEYDEIRTAVFDSKGIKTYRLRNEDCDLQHLTPLINNMIATASSKPLPLSTLERGPGGEVPKSTTY
jgi:very-short-patch-repair endonuclease